MNARRDVVKEEVERQGRRKIFQYSFAVVFVLASGFLFWQLRILLLPILVGSLLAYLFRPIKDQFKIAWLPHELQVLASFAVIALLLFATVATVRSHIPNERQKLELKVRLKYKLNEKLQEIVKPKEGRPNVILSMVAKEASPLVDRINRWLDLSQEEVELFMKYRVGLEGEPKIEERYFEFFQVNQSTDLKAAMEREALQREAEAKAQAGGLDSQATRAAAKAEAAASDQKMDHMEVWILAPILFFFLGFDNGQIRRYIIGLVPNRYFELSLTVMDQLDDAIGKYLRGTLIESALVGLTLILGMILLGIPMSVAVAIGVISGLINAIPFLGTFIGMMIALGYALIAENIVPLIPGLNPSDLALYVVLLVALAHVLDNIIFQPFVLGSAVNLHPLVVVLAIISGSLLMGLWGMLFAIPTVVVLKTATETLFRELRDYRII